MLEYTLRDGTTTTDTVRWATLYENHDYRSVKRTAVSDDVTVSTIWQGIPSFGDDDPNVYETMILGGPYSNTFLRWWTEEEAVAGHDALVAALTANPDANPIPE